jgi:hypothetical protein
MSRDYDWPAFRQCHFGTSGIGKTTHFLETLKHTLKQKIHGVKRSTIFIYDHKDREFSKKLSKTVVTTQAQLEEAAARGGYVLFDPSAMFPGNKVKGFDFLCAWLYAVADAIPGRKILVTDELQIVTDVDNDPDSLILCMDDARTYRVDCMFIAQGANAIHNRIKNQLTELFVFRQAEENAIKFLRSLGFDENSVRALKPGEWLWKNCNTGLMAAGGKPFEIKNNGLPPGARPITVANEQPAQLEGPKVTAPDQKPEIVEGKNA